MLMGHSVVGVVACANPSRRIPLRLALQKFTRGSPETSIGQLWSAGQDLVDVGASHRVFSTELVSELRLGVDAEIAGAENEHVVVRHEVAERPENAIDDHAAGGL